MNTGEFAKLCGVEKRTLFHYDALGLLQPFCIHENGYRDYVPSQVEQMDMIKLLQASGYSLKEISEILAQTAKEKRESFFSAAKLMDEKIAEMTAMRQYIRKKEQLYRQYQEWKAAERPCFVQSMRMAYVQKPIEGNAHYFCFLNDGDYDGIMIDGNHHYLHSDGTVTHNSGKSYAASTFIERLTFEYNPIEDVCHNILYLRYTMTSAGMSIIPEFTEKIDVDGTSEFFRSTKTDVVNKMTGARVMFRGIHTSSGNQTAKLKSIHGVTTMVVDEGEEWTTYDEYEKIMLSIRQKGLRNRVIIIMNPADSNHFVYEKYIKDTHKLVEYDGVPVQISTHPNVLHIHTSYLDNIEHLSDDFLQAAREMKEKDPERYAHVFMGRWDDVAEGAVFKKFGIVDEFPEACKHVALGMDFGYFPDPSAVVRCGVIGKRLYVDEVAYAQGWHAPQAAACLNEYPGLFTYAECADERFAKDISNLGPILYRVQKGPGSIKAGINKMLEYELFITKRSVNLEHELRNYVWAKDIFGNNTGLPEDHDNHLIDAARYYVNGCILGHILKPRSTTKEELGIY